MDDFIHADTTCVLVAPQRGCAVGPRPLPVPWGLFQPQQPYQWPQNFSFGVSFHCCVFIWDQVSKRSLGFCFPPPVLFQGAQSSFEVLLGWSRLRIHGGIRYAGVSSRVSHPPDAELAPPLESLSQGFSHEIGSMCKEMQENAQGCAISQR